MIGYYSFQETDGVNHGESTRLKNDVGMFQQDSISSVVPSLYTHDTNRIINCNRCLNIEGERLTNGAGYYGVSTLTDNAYFPNNESMHLDNILSGRHATRKGMKGGRVTNFNVDEQNQYLRHKPLCDKQLYSTETRLNMPVKNYRELTVNRFYTTNLPMELTDNRFTFGSLTQLEAKDKYVERKPYILKGGRWA